MAAEKTHPIRNSVIATLIAGALTTLVVYLIPGGWAWIVKEGKRVIGAVVTWLGSSLAVPAWLVVILSLLAFVVVIAVAVVAIAIMRKSDDRIESFTEADFFGIKWRWRYGQHGVYSITSYCPVCDLQIYPSSASHSFTVERIVYRCDNGHWESQELEGSQSDIENRVEREIHRQLRRKADEAKRQRA